MIIPYRESTFAEIAEANGISHSLTSKRLIPLIKKNIITIKKKDGVYVYTKTSGATNSPSIPDNGLRYV